MAVFILFCFFFLPGDGDGPRVGETGREQRLEPRRRRVDGVEQVVDAVAVRLGPRPVDGVVVLAPAPEGQHQRQRAAQQEHVAHFEVEPRRATPTARTPVPAPTEFLKKIYTSSSVSRGPRGILVCWTTRFVSWPVTKLY